MIFFLIDIRFKNTTANVIPHYHPAVYADLVTLIYDQKIKINILSELAEQ